MGRLLLLALLCSCIWAIAGETIDMIYDETVIIKNGFDRMDQHEVLLECHNNNAAFDLVWCAVWTRGGEIFVPDSSRITINENGTITIAPPLPQDEGEYRCGPDEESLGERFNFAVSPHAQKKSRQMFGHLGSNFSIPCLVEIGPISRQQGFSVEWTQGTQQLTGLPLNALILYEGNASEADTTLIPSLFDSSHIFNVSDLSLLVYDFSVPDVNRKEIYYTCRVSAGPLRQQQASATTNVTIQFTPIEIVTPLPGLIIGYPGELITESFVYKGAPVIEHSLTLAGENIAESGKFNFRRELQSNNSTKIFLEFPDPQEDDSGLLNITLTGVNSTDGTESHLIITPEITNLKLTCGEPILSFELPQQILRPGMNLQLQTKVRFSEVPPFGTANSESGVVNATYEIETATTQDCPSDAERCTVDIGLSGRLPNEVAEFVRYRAEALLLVNGIEGHQFSLSTMSILHDCNAPLEQETLMLAVEFIGETECSAVVSESISETVQNAIQGRCNFNCDDLIFGTPQLICSADNRNGHFTVEVTAFEAKAVVADFHSVEPVLIVSDAAYVSIRCPTCMSHGPAKDVKRYVISGPVVVIIVLILIVLGFIFTVVMRKRKKSHAISHREDSRYTASRDIQHPGNIELEQVQPIQIIRDPPQRSPISLTIRTAICSHTEQTHAHPTPNTQYGDPSLNVPADMMNQWVKGGQHVEVVAAQKGVGLLPSLQLHEAATLARAQKYNSLHLHRSTASLPKYNISRMSPMIPVSASSSLLGHTRENERESLRTLEVRLKPTRVHFQGYKTQPQARHSHILSGSVYVFDSHFNQPSDSNMTTTSIDHDTVEYGSGGGMYINRTHDITIKIPERAIPEGTVLQLLVSAMLYGPFLFPAGLRPVSPILWLCTHPTLTFSRPIEVVLPHYLHCEDQNDTEKFIFLKADHNSRIDGKFHFKPADGESVFKHHTNYGTLHTNHCCFLCIAAKRTEKDTPKINLSLITAYPRNPQEHPWNVCFGVTYLQPTCMQAFRNQFTDDYQILRARKFRMQDTAERKIEICYPENLPQQWVAGLNGSNEILASDVDFWSIWNRNPTELKIMEQEKMYPPNFDVIIDGRSAVGNAKLTASFTGIERPLVVEIPLLLPASTQHEIPNVEACASQEGLKPKVSNRTDEQDDTIELKELCLELHTVDGWFKLGIYLGISYSELKIIEVQHHDPHRCRMEMLQAWLNNFQPSWSAVIEALKLLEMSQLAKRLAAKKVSPVHVPLHVQTTSPTPPQGYFTHQPAQPRQTHQHQFSSTGHMRGVRGRSTLHVSKAAVTETLC